MDIRPLKKGYEGVDQPVETTGKQQIGIHNLPPEVLEHIFYYLRLRDLLNCRLVHPSWKKSATKPCRDKTNEIQFAYQEDVHRALLMRDFMSLLHKSTDVQSFPTAKLRVGIGLETNQPTAKKNFADEITNFFNTIASFVTEFTLVVSLTNVTYHSYKFLPEDLKFQRLKCFTLCLRNYVDVSNGDDSFENEKRSLLNFIRGVVENAEALKQIALKIGNQLETPTAAILMCVEECGIRSKLKLLTYLKIKVNAAQVDWVTLANMGLKLQRLSIVLEDTTAGRGDTLKGFLQSQSDTLTALEINHSPWPVFDNEVDDNYHFTKCSMSFPTMTRLKSLEIASTAYENVEEDEPVDLQILEILDFSYMKQFPALKQLNLKQVKVIWPCFLRDYGGPLNTLEELVLPVYCYDENAILKAATLFPNIKKLHVAAKKNMLLAVYEAMKNLDDLTLYTTAETSIDDICEVPNVVGPRVAKINAWKKLLRVSSGKSLISLENLKILRLRTDWSESEEFMERMLEFGDTSGLVFREMKSLKCLDLGVRTFSNSNNELALLDDLRKTLDVLLTNKGEKLRRRKFYRRKFRGGGMYDYVPAESSEFFNLLEIKWFGNRWC